VVLRDRVSKSKLSALRERLLDELELSQRDQSLFVGGGLISGHLNCFPGEESRFIYDTLERQGVIDFVKSLLPTPMYMPNVGCNMNLPKSAPQHYHVDGLFLEPFLIINTAVVDTDISNGAIDVLPKTHKRFYKFSRFMFERLDKLTTRVPLGQGDVLIRHSNLWHRGMPNYSGTARPMAALTWENGGGEKDGFRKNDGKIGFYPNWFSTGRIGRLRERTFVTVPQSYDAYRFVRSLVGNKGYASW